MNSMATKILTAIVAALTCVVLFGGQVKSAGLPRTARGHDEPRFALNNPSQQEPQLVRQIEDLRETVAELATLKEQTTADIGLLLDRRQAVLTQILAAEERLESVTTELRKVEQWTNSLRTELAELSKGIVDARHQLQELVKEREKSADQNVQIRTKTFAPAPTCRPPIQAYGCPKRRACR